VRSAETEADYVTLFNAIMASPVIERHKGRRKRYL
jgi:hypothetical protein